MRRFFVLGAALMADASQAQLIVGNDQSGAATMYEVYVNTGVATALYSASSNSAKPWAIAADNRVGILYWSNGSTLYSASFASLFGGTANPATVTMTFNSVNTNFVGLGFNQATGKLLATRNIATEAVYEIDPVTGVAM